MNKSRYFVIAPIVTAIMLLILGNWVTSAQATSTDIVDATLIPTSTPAGTPIAPLGEIPSMKEQEELKAVVQSYIETRYRALSVSNAETFKQSDFGNLVSETAEAEAFLSEETGKLAVEINHAKLNHLRYSARRGSTTPPRHDRKVSRFV